MALVQRFASLAAGSAVVNYPVAVAANTGFGNTLILVGRTGSTVTVSSVSDSKGNNWTVDANNSSGTGRCFIASTNTGLALTTSDTMTVHLSASQAPVVAAYEYAGTLVPDQHVLKDVAAGTTCVIPASPTTLFPVEVAVTVCGSSIAQATTFSPSAGWTKEDSGQAASAISCQFADQIVTVCQTLACTWTVGTSASVMGAIVTYTLIPAPIPARAPLSV